MKNAGVRAVFFDVDFTLIYPGPTFQGEGYAVFCRRFGIAVDPARFPDAVTAASSILYEDQDHVYDAAIFVRYTRRIIEAMGGTGETLDACAEEIYSEWAACQHFLLYDDVAPALRELAARGVKIGLISNSHRCLASFERHFSLQGLITAAVSSSEHGYLPADGPTFTGSQLTDEALRPVDGSDADSKGRIEHKLDFFRGRVADIRHGRFNGVARR